MRVLALDIGEKRIGVAVSDPSRRVATPVTVLDAAAAAQGGRDIRRLVEDFEPCLLLVGLPLSMNGEEGPQAVRVRRVAEQISVGTGIAVEYADERLSSAAASRAMSDAGLSTRQQRGRIDAVAASLFLQAWLDSRPRDKEECDDA